MKDLEKMQTNDTVPYGNREAWRRLTKLQRQIVRLACAEGLSNNEICERTGKGPTAVQSALMLARLKLGLSETGQRRLVWWWFTHGPGSQREAA